MPRAALAPTALFGAALLSAAALAPLAHAADKPAASAAAYKAPRTAFGQPDLSGHWTNATLTPMTRSPTVGGRSVYTEDEVKKMESAVAQEIEEGNEPTDPDAPVEAPKSPANVRPEFAAAGGDVGGYNRGWLDPGNHVMRVRGEPRTSLITTPNGLPPARKPGAPSGGGFRGGMGAFDHPEQRSLGERCILSFGRNAGPPMFPNGFYNNNYQILQTPDSVLIEVEMVHDLRVVRLNSKHRTDDVRPYMGDSIGWWEGDTLVVETTHIPQAQQFMGSWKNLKVTERFTRVGKQRLHYAFQVEDPTVWESAWGGEYEFSPMEKGVIYEYACHEGNYALPGILGGARQQEKEAAAAKSGAAPAASQP
ncbi:MAG: hypothetical protein JNK30_21355 [Phenylobacterium sp.]|uniref:hypothetical protein n=1 Tax=Phenylobacterium sp. TaxID=1871053 RepID=UPI001A38608D|nr:hypothetical protein [Phenylobacterium sp.]MBL8773947.1 hypothetical protein [Phenylobacterium sp.]